MSMQFKIGDFVIYGVYGRCEITGIEIKTLNQKEQSFYELRPVVESQSDSKFLIPVTKAVENGLRQEIDVEEVDGILEILVSPEYFIDMRMPWIDKEKEIERMIRYQGATGLAKSVRHLFMYHQLTAFPEPAATKVYKKIFKVLAREIAQVLNKTLKETEILMTKALSTKIKKTQ